MAFTTLKPNHAAAKRDLFQAAWLLLLCSVLTPVRAESPLVQNPHPYGTPEHNAFTAFSKRHEAVFSAYQEIADAFNRRLAGRYPFGPLDAPDVPRRDVCDFYRNHGQRIIAVHNILKARKEFAPEVRFLNQIDAIGTFLSGNACSRFNQPIRIGFHPEAAPASSKPDLVWTLGDDFGRARVPHGASTLDWRFGAPLSLDVTWAPHTGLRPRAAAPHDPFQTPDSATIRYRVSGDWALKRFMDAYRDRYGPDRKQDSAAVSLRFRAPLVPILVPTPRTSRDEESWVLLNVELRFEHYAAGGPRQPLKWPGTFPVAAP